ncbi:EF-P 5-aminopentanol modification-associated protein YfmH [Lacticaseibacillus daqingensis]|uniref:EF-P 5-aminopentanol modification-associated protein YfmH n=1 Tax=Lacticaseibacillus daqingensis TaxID=2486014 RepID=UPI000F784B16|nr:pitrilysin family protein [Lacticaseibacillus daqingensis]
MQQDYPEVSETLITQTLPNGLRVLIVPKPDYHETYAQFAVDYGGIDTRYVPVGGSEMVQDPEGIAHFLEHKLFEKADHDAFDLFGATGASANAFTGATSTAYLFSTSQAVAENLTTLLDFVQDPYFTAQTVAKEKGIIGQEIQMYQDSPGWLLYYGILGNLYPDHPVAHDVTGSLESIDRITPEALYQAYQTFYQPSNMTLTIVGNVDPAALLALIEANQAAKSFAPATPITRGVAFDGDVATILPYRALNLPVVRPKSAVGLKGQRDIGGDQAGTRYQVAVRLLLEMLFGDSSPLYQDWYDRGLIDDSFDYDYQVARTFNYVTFAGDTEDPQALSDAIVAVLAQGADQPSLTEARFARLKQAGLGKYYQSLNSLERIAGQLSAQSFTAVNAFELADVMRAVTLDELKTIAGELFDLAAVSVCHVLPEVSE